MRCHGLQSVCRRRWRRPRRPSAHAIAAANTLQPEFTAAQPTQQWAGDITYVRTREGWLYVAVLMDLYSRCLIAWAMGDSLTTDLAVQALDMAVCRREVGTGLLPHSGRGRQYGAWPYQDRLSALGIQCSMSRHGTCYDNAVVESFFATLKTELFTGECI